MPICNTALEMVRFLIKLPGRCVPEMQSRNLKKKTKHKTFRWVLVQLIVPVVTSLSSDSFQAWEGIMSLLYAGPGLIFPVCPVLTTTELKIVGHGWDMILTDKHSCVTDLLSLGTPLKGTDCMCHSRAGALLFSVKLWCLQADLLQPIWFRTLVAHQRSCSRLTVQVPREFVATECSLTKSPCLILQAYIVTLNALALKEWSIQWLGNLILTIAAI